MMLESSSPAFRALEMIPLVAAMCLGPVDLHSKPSVWIVEGSTFNDDGSPTRHRQSRIQHILPIDIEQLILDRHTPLGLLIHAVAVAIKFVHLVYST